jgi:hypothetical protein
VKITYSTLRTPPRRSRRSSGGGSSNGTPAAAIVFFAAVIRAWTVGTDTRNARAISSLDGPPTARSVRATRAGRESTGWQTTNISASTSSSTRSGSHGSSSDRSRRAIAPEFASPSGSWNASMAYRSSSADRRRKLSMARRRAVVSSQPTGFAVAPSRDQVMSASATASCATSSASSKSLV